LSYRGHTQLIAGQATRKNGLPEEAARKRAAYRDEVRQKLSSMGHINMLHENLLKLIAIESETAQQQQPSREFISKQVTRIQALRESSNLMLKLMGKYLPNLAPEALEGGDDLPPEAQAHAFFQALRMMQAADTGQPVLMEDDEEEEAE
jgi:hypothetical protein